MIAVGLHRDVPEHVYHADPCERPALSASIARVLLDQSAAHAYARHPRLGGQPSAPTGAMERGTLIHALILGGAPVVAVNAENWRTKAAREARDEARAAGSIPILAHELADLTAAADAIRGQLPPWVEGAHHEVTAVWDIDGVLCRGRVDVLDAHRILDLKTTRDASPEAMARAVIRYGYDVQAAAYSEAIRELTAARHVEYTIAAVELEPPYAVGLYTLDGELRERGEHRWMIAQARWAGCIATGEWPVGYGGRLECPPWAGVEYEYEEDER